VIVPDGVMLVLPGGATHNSLWRIPIYAKFLAQTEEVSKAIATDYELAYLSFRIRVVAKLRDARQVNRVV
jgi:hypothetical protein